MGYQQLLAKGMTQLLVIFVKNVGVFIDAEYPADQGETVGVYAAGGHPDQDISRFHGGGIESLLLLDDADDESRQVEVPLGVHTRHLCRLPADQGAPGLPAGPRHAPYQGVDPVQPLVAGRHIVQEEERLGALGQHIVDVQVDEVDAQGLVVAQEGSHLQLGADAVGAGYQDGVIVALKLEESGETAGAPKHLGTVGQAGESGYAVLDAGQGAGVHPRR